MKIRLLALIFVVGLIVSGYMFKDRAEAMLRAKLREIAKQELLVPIKAKIKKVLSRSKVRLAKKRQRMNLLASRV